MEWFARWGRDRPDTPFVVTAGDRVTFGVAAERISDLAGRLRDRLPSGARVGVRMQPTVDHVLLAFAVPAAGMTLVPLPRAGGGELASLASVHAVLGPGLELAGSSPAVETDAGSAFAAVFTSGSSDTPRAVRLTWGNVEANAAASAAHLDHGPDDRWLAVLPLHHVSGLSILWRSARQGTTVVLHDGFDPDRVAETLTAGEVTLGSFVSAMLERLADAGLERAPGFRLGLVGGGPATERALGVAGMRLLATYGMTETASQIATADPADPRPDRLVPLLGARIGLESGRIVVDGPMVSPGDLDAPDRVGSLVTSDVGRFHGDRLEVLGRVDDVIVTGGENVMPQRVERILGLVGAGDVAVVGVPDERWGSIVCAAYTGPASPEELVAAGTALASYEIPRRWLRVTAIPRLGIEKIDRQAVRSLFD